MFTTIISLSISLFLYFLAKYRVAINIIFLLSVFALIATNTHNHDFYGYQMIFENPFAFTEPGYALLVESLKLIGGSGHESVLFVFGLLVLYTFIRLLKYSKFIYLYIFLYFIYLLPLDITQIRFGIASFIFINAVVALSQGKKFIAISVSLISISFHFIMIVPVIILLTSLFRANKIVSISFIITSFILSIAFFEFILKQAVLAGVSPRTLAFYIAENRLHLQFYMWVIPIVAALIFFKYNENSSSILGSKSFPLYSLIIKISVISLIFSPGLFYIVEFHRIYRLVVMLLLLNGVLLMAHMRFNSGLNVYIGLVALSGFYGVLIAVGINYDYIYWGLGEPRIN